MNELSEITEGKTIDELKVELKFQQEMGETLGGTICSHIRFVIATLERAMPVAV